MTTTRPRKKRLSAKEKADRAAWAHREERTKRNLVEQAQRAITLRSKDREFHGLEREFLDFQNQMRLDYERSKDIKHPRDVGDAREVILRKFLSENKLLPARYSVSSTSVRVASTSGHVSNELDILLYNTLDSITLMRRQGVYEVHPVESCYGAIQVKSRLNKKEIRDGLDNIASFKKLNRMQQSESQFLHDGIQRQNNGFGILFAYDTDLDWLDIVHELNLYASEHPRHHLCNAVFVLSKGFLMYGDGQKASAYNNDIEKFPEIRIHGYPDRSNQCLYGFYDIICSLLNSTTTSIVPPSKYFRLPMTAGEYSYEYMLGHFAEFSKCHKHGDFAKKFTPENLSEVIKWCKEAEYINWIKAIELAYGNAGDNIEAYARQPNDVKIYNPENLELSEILVMDDEMLWDGKIGGCRS